MWSGSWNTAGTVFTGTYNPVTPLPSDWPTGTTMWTGTVTLNSGTAGSVTANYTFAGVYS